MSKTVELSCQCGEVQGQLNIVPKSYFHVHCLCIDCQNFATYLKNEALILDEYGGSELLQTYPQHLTISKGVEHITAIQHQEKGLYRWFTSCCHTPLANTMHAAHIPFVGVSVKMMTLENEAQKLAVLGPVSIKAFAKYARGDAPKDAHQRFPLSYMPKIIGFMLKGMLRKQHKPSPFFQGKTPITAVKRLY